MNSLEHAKAFAEELFGPEKLFAGNDFQEALPIIQKAMDVYANEVLALAKATEQSGLLNIHAICDERDKLREQNRELLKDKERLEGLIEKKGIVAGTEKGDGCKFVIFMECELIGGGTFREAIDKALDKAALAKGEKAMKRSTQLVFRNAAAAKRMAAHYRKQMGLGLDGQPRRYGPKKKALAKERSE